MPVAVRWKAGLGVIVVDCQRTEALRAATRFSYTEDVGQIKRVGNDADRTSRDDAKSGVREHGS